MIVSNRYVSRVLTSVVIISCRERKFACMYVYEHEEFVYMEQQYMVASVLYHVLGINHDSLLFSPVGESITGGTFAKYSENKITICATCNTLELSAVAGKTLNANSIATNKTNLTTNVRFVRHIIKGTAWKYHE